MGYWDNKRVLITGSEGFLGKHLIKKFNEAGVEPIGVSHKDYELTRLDDIKRLLGNTKPDIVIHLAALVGGIGANSRRSAEFFYNNAMMGIQLLHESWKHGVEKYIGLGTICSYPKYCPVPFIEENLWEGFPESTNSAYGIAKKALLVQGQAYRQQYGFNSIFLMPTNLYGEWDSLNLEDNHVLPAIIRKCLESRGDVELWGSGSPTREFLYAGDCAEGIILATEKYDSSEPVNLGGSDEATIYYVAELIAKLTGFTGKFVWDKSRPDGQPRRKVNTDRAKREFGFVAKTPLEEGLKKTIEWVKTQLPL